MFSSLQRSSTLMILIVLVLVALSGVTGLIASTKQKAAREEMAAASALLENHMEADMMHDAVRADVLGLLIAGHSGGAIDEAASRRDLADHAATLKAAIVTDLAYTGSAEVSAATRVVSAQVTEYERAALDIARVARKNPEKGLAALPGFLDAFRTLEGSMAKVSEGIERHAEEISARADAVSRFAKWLIAACLGISLLIALLMGYASRRYLIVPLVALVAAVREMAGGNLATAIPVKARRDELGQLARAMEAFRDQLKEGREAADRATRAQSELIVSSIGSALEALSQGDLTASVDAELPSGFAQLKSNFNEALSSLRSLIGAVGMSAEAIRTGSGEIASASEDLARRTEGNAASLEETSAALVQIDGRLKASASASVSTVARADQAIATVGGGRAIAEEAVQAMGRVSDSAKGIDSVIEGLDKIAFQTRVLAMNAAVEAGRAGDAGRGFAVVADLVSALAMRAEEEAKRARDQLTVTQTDIVTAVEAVQRVDGALANISGDVGEVHKLLGGMAEDNQAQSAAITQITAAIGSMDQSTQENAAMVEETSAAARNLTAEVASLSEQTSAFKIDDGAPSRKPAPLAVSPKKQAAAYVSPVKALPAKPRPNGKANGHDADNWAAF